MYVSIATVSDENEWSKLKKRWTSLVWERNWENWTLNKLQMQINRKKSE